MGEIKSAFEKAMEKVESLEKPSEQELRKWKYIPEGEKLATRYLKDECSLVVELVRQDESVKRYIAEGAQEILLRNIDLPKNNAIKGGNKKAMEGIKALKSNKVEVENVYSKMRGIFEHYEQQGEGQRKQAYQRLKGSFEMKLQQAIQQQLGTPLAGIKIDVERQPQFQEEWRRTLAQLDSQYYKLLDEYKHEIQAIP
jgi:hypothetical protein